MPDPTGRTDATFRAECHNEIIIQFDLFIDRLDFWCLIDRRKRRLQPRRMLQRVLKAGAPAFFILGRI
ncbi:hypothetical protein CN934_05375 [Ensifer sp. MMN_5]|nr:hypothetical protein CN934_05375 [Ensifer sp. MMN_5]